MNRDALEDEILDADLHELIAGTRTVSAPSDDVLLRARQALAGHTGTTGTDPSRRAVIVAAAAVAAATVTGVSVAPKLLSGNAFHAVPGRRAARLPKPAGSVSVASWCGYLAQQVVDLGLPEWRSAAFWFRRTVSTDDMAERSEWTGHSIPGRVVQTGHPTVRQPVGEYWIYGEDLTWDGLWSLPADPQQLLQRLRGGYQLTATFTYDDDTEVWTTVNDLLTRSPAPPALRAALFRVLGMLPAQAVRETTDRAGRAGVAFARQVDGLQFSYVYDPDTGTPLEKRVGRAATTLLEVGWVDSITAYPDSTRRLPRPPTSNEIQELGGPPGPYSIYSPASSR